MIKNMLFSITQYELIKVSRYPTLLSIGLGLATTDGKSKPLRATEMVIYSKGIGTLACTRVCCIFALYLSAQTAYTVLRDGGGTDQKWHE